MKQKPLKIYLILSAALLASCAGANSSSLASSSQPSSVSEPAAVSEGSSEQSQESPEASSELPPVASSETPSSSVSEQPKTFEKVVNAYRLFNVDNEYLDPDLSEAKYQLGSLPLQFVKGEEFVPYVSMSNLTEFYSRLFKDKEKVKGAVTEKDDKVTWTVTVSDKEVFSSSIDVAAKTFTYSGSLEPCMSTKKNYSLYSLGIRTKNETTLIDLPTAHPVLVSFADTEFEIVKEGGKNYFPFSMMNTLYRELVGHEFFYNYTYIYEFNEVDDLSKATITEGENVYTPMQQMEEYIVANVKEKDKHNKPLMPLYLRKHHRSEFALIMNHFYGLKNTWGVKSMMDYYKAFGLYDAFIDEAAAVRGAAYSKAFFMLGDNHTGRVILGDDPWVESNGNNEVQSATKDPKVEERSILSNALTDQREAFLKANGFEDGIKNAIVYSKDGKTAYFGFDSFDATTNAYKSDGTVKSDETLANYDSYFYFAKQLKAIKEHTTEVGGTTVKVERVIIDDSLNGGGYVAVMGRLLALMSKDNSSAIITRNDLSDVLAKYTYKVDTNNDGAYDAQDVYGNDFKFYILTSPVSFSCGNAFPILASKFDHVRIIGQRSGGGECVVAQNYMSNGMGFVHSSNEHLTLYNEADKTYEGVEDGCKVNGVIKYNDFYNMEKMEKAINSIVN